MITRNRILLLLSLLILGAGSTRAANWTCYATGEPFSTCSTIYSIKSQPEIVLTGGPTEGSPRRSEGAFKFDVSAIPAATVTVIEFHFYVSMVSSTPYWSITPVTCDPVATLAGPLWTDIHAEATSGYYNYFVESSSYTPGWKSKILGGTATADLTAIIHSAQDWFAFGALLWGASPSETMNLGGYSTANPPYIVVVAEMAGTLECSYGIDPPGGTVPFVTHHQVTLTNVYAGGTRQMAGRIDVRLANGSSYSNWRSGYTNIAPGASFVEQWNQTIPALAAVIGDSQFSLLAVDVTPPPYNQPPYPASGDTCEVWNTVTACAP